MGEDVDGRGLFPEVPGRRPRRLKGDYRPEPTGRHRQDPYQAPDADGRPARPDPERPWPGEGLGSRRPAPRTQPAPPAVRDVRVRPSSPMAAAEMDRPGPRPVVPGRSQPPPGPMPRAAAEPRAGQRTTAAPRAPAGVMRSRMEPHGTSRMEPHGTSRMEPHGTSRMEPHGTGRMGPHGTGRMGPYGTGPGPGRPHPGGASPGQTAGAFLARAQGAAFRSVADGRTLDRLRGRSGMASGRSPGKGGRSPGNGRRTGPDRLFSSDIRVSSIILAAAVLLALGLLARWVGDPQAGGEGPAGRPVPVRYGSLGPTSTSTLLTGSGDLAGPARRSLSENTHQPPADGPPLHLA
jgi:hypothetical protein